MSTPPMPPLSHDQVVEALTRFDAEYREAPEWQGWENRLNHKYAIEYRGALYPVKKVVSLASGVPTKAFGGGKPANSLIEHAGFDVIPLRSYNTENDTFPNDLRWWVNQGSSFKDESNGGYIWAPLKTKSGSVVQHHANVAEVRQGDGIIHYANGFIRSLGIVVSEPRKAPRPPQAHGSESVTDGYLASVGYTHLVEPLALDDIPIDWRLAEGGPFTKSGSVNVGYLYPLHRKFVQQMGDRLSDRLEDEEEAGAASWIFQANPSRYDIVGALGSLTEMTWTINQYRHSIHEGDTAYIWMSGAAGGIVATATILTEPTSMKVGVEEDAFWRDDDPHRREERHRVKLKITRVLPTTLKKGTMAERPELANLAVIRFPNATNFRVIPNEAAVIEQMIADMPAKQPISGRYWAIAPGEGARLWTDFLSSGIVAVGWDSIGDLSKFTDKEAVSSALADVRAGDQRPVNDSLACYQFTHEMQPGDFVFAKRGISEILGYGVIRGEYEYSPDRAEYRNTRSVDWTAQGSWELPEDVQLPMKTLTDVSSYRRFIDFILPLVSTASAKKAVHESPSGHQKGEPYTIDDALSDVFLSRADLTKIVDTLARKKNVILQGAPGVGKTFLAKRIAYALMGHRDPARIEMVQFHQSYAYEDFVQGWRPTEDRFALHNGIFYRFCKKAEKKESDAYVFIIDEINRGNLSKVFGELMMLIEGDKRGEEFAIPLAYSRNSGERFCVPKNMYIIGLMNTADRSLAMVDYALRRRFAFFQLKPEFGSPGFRAFLTEKGADSALIDLIIDRLSNLNGEIAADEKHLGPGFAIGHSFFCPQGTEETLDGQWYIDVIASEVAPLLHEYWFDDSEKAEEWVRQLLP